MIMMPYSWRWPSLQLTGQADFWHPTGAPSRRTYRPARSRSSRRAHQRYGRDPVKTSRRTARGSQPLAGRWRAGSVLTPHPAARRLPAETAIRSTITQIYEGTNQIQRMVMARQLLK